uniref:Novel protein similar to envelope protein (Env), Uncharacterized protein n=1 Tax=Nothobranchius pienaari TaxID=704102 RepID=A0A1A8MTY3_9TELE
MSWPFPPILTCAQRLHILLLTVILICIPLVILLRHLPSSLEHNLPLSPSPPTSPEATPLTPTTHPPPPIDRHKRSLSLPSPSPPCASDFLYLTQAVTLCIPLSTATTVTLPYDVLPSNPAHGHYTPSDLKEHVWYLTWGSYSQWKWSNVVAETGDDWSSYSKGVATTWRTRIKLIKQGGSKIGPLTFIISPLHSLGCTLFVLAPWISGSYYWTVHLCVRNITSPTSSVFDIVGISKSPSPTVLADITKVNKPSPAITIESKNLTVDETFQTVTGISASTNNWLLLAEQAANASEHDCLVCLAARPTLRIVPPPIPPECVLHLMNGTSLNSNCTKFGQVFPKQKPGDDVGTPLFSNVVAPNNFSCIQLIGRGGPFLGNVTTNWCVNTTVSVSSQFNPKKRANLWWWCGAPQLYNGFPRKSSGLCALITLLLPVSVTPVTLHDTPVSSSSSSTRRKRSIPSLPDYHNPTYIDAIGVPRGVPDEYKLVDQIAAGWESIFVWITPNKNVDRINYIHFNVQLLSNYTRTALEAVHQQLSATSLMAFQNRIAVDMLLAEKGGVCSMFAQNCCVFIPNNTAADGSLTKALDGLRSLTDKMKSHSGVDTSMWDSWLDIFGKYKSLVASALVSMSVFAAILVTCGCCCIPCLRQLTQRLITTAISPPPADPIIQMPLLLTNPNIYLGGDPATDSDDSHAEEDDVRV